MLRRRAYFHSLDLTNGSSTHPLATDVTAKNFEPSELAKVFRLSCEARCDIAVDFDHGFSLPDPAPLHRDRLVHDEDADIGDVLANFEWLGIFAGLDRAQENRPQPAIEQYALCILAPGPVQLVWMSRTAWPLSAVPAPRFPWPSRSSVRCVHRLGRHWTFITPTGITQHADARTARVL